MIWCHPRKDVFQSFPNTYSHKRWFLLANTTWKWQKVKNYWKKRKKLFGNFFWHDVIQESAWFRALLTSIFKKTVFTSKHTIEMAKSERLLKKKKKIFFRGFFWYHTRKGGVLFSTFFLEQLSNSQKIRLFQVNLLISLGDISKKPNSRAFCTPLPNLWNKIGLIVEFQIFFKS